MDNKRPPQLAACSISSGGAALDVQFPTPKTSLAAMVNRTPCRKKVSSSPQKRTPGSLRTRGLLGCCLNLGFWLGGRGVGGWGAAQPAFSDSSRTAPPPTQVTPG